MAVTNHGRKLASSGRRHWVGTAWWPAKEVSVTNDYLAEMSAVAKLETLASDPSDHWLWRSHFALPSKVRLLQLGN